MKSYYSFLFIYLFFLNINYYVVESAQCNDPQSLGALTYAARTTYYFIDIQYKFTGVAPFIEFGGVGQLTGARAQPFINDVGALVLRVDKSDTYDLYYTFNVSGVPCNVSITTPPQYLATLSVVPPKCVGSNVTITVDYPPAQNFTVKFISNKKSISFNFTTSTFQFPVPQPTGEYALVTSDYASTWSTMQMPFKISATDSSLVPKFELYPFTFNSDNDTRQIFKITNYQSFQTININNKATGESLQPISHGVYKYESGAEYDILLTSSTCGTQSFSTKLLATKPNLISTVLPPASCIDNNLEVSFAIENANSSLYTMKVNGGQYTIGSRYYAGVTNDIKVDVSIINSSLPAFSYVYTAPLPTMNVSYTILVKPTCNSNGLARVNFDGKPYLISVNGVEFLANATDLTFELLYNKDYAIKHRCYQNVINFVAGPGAPYYQTSITEDTCMGRTTVIVPNYYSYDSVILYDSYNQVNFTTTNGIFTDLPPLYNIQYYYQLCGGTKQFLSSKMSTGYKISLPGSDKFSVKFTYNTTGMCALKYNVTADIYYKGKFIQQTTKLLNFGALMDLPINQFGYCQNYPYKTIVPNKLNTTSIKIIKPAICSNSDATIQFISDDSKNFQSIKIDGNDVSRTNNFIYSVKPGRHSAEVQINGGSYCYSIFDFDIPYQSEMKMNFTAKKQDSNKCDIATGQITIENPQEYESILLNGYPSDNEPGIFKELTSGNHSLYLNHSVCGVGNFQVPVETDSQLLLKDIQTTTCGIIGQGNGIYQPYTLTTNGTILTKFDRVFTSRTYNPQLTWYVGVPIGYFKSVYFLGYCRWDTENDIQQKDIPFKVTNIKSNNQILDILGSAQLENTTNVRIETVYDDEYSYFRYPRDVVGLAMDSGTLGVSVIYNGKCGVRIPTPAPKPITLDYEILGQCGSLDISASFNNDFLSDYDIRSPVGFSQSGGAVKVYKNSPISLTRVSDGYQSSPTISRGIGFALQNIPKPIITSMTSESCLNNGDGSFTIGNYDTSKYSYWLSDVNGKYFQSNGSTWSGLISGDYQFIVSSLVNHTCAYRQTVTIKANQPVVTATVTKNQCAIGESGTVVFKTIMGGSTINSYQYQINGTIYTENTLNFPPGIYNYVAFIIESNCRQMVNGSFEIKSNVYLNTIVSSPKCSTARVEVSDGTSSPPSGLIIKLYNITNNSNPSLVGSPVTGYTADFNNLKNGTYRFVVTDGATCEVSSKSIDIVECSTPTNTPSNTPSSTSSTTGSSTTSNDSSSSSSTTTTTSSSSTTITSTSTTSSSTTSKTSTDSLNDSNQILPQLSYLFILCILITINLI